MPERMQMADGKTRAADEVAVDTDAVQLGGGGTDGDDGHVMTQALERFRQTGTFIAPDVSGEDSADKATPNQLVNQLAGDRLVIFCLKQPERVSVGHGCGVGGVKHARKIRIENLRQNDGKRF